MVIPLSHVLPHRRNRVHGTMTDHRLRRPDDLPDSPTPGSGGQRSIGFEQFVGGVEVSRCAVGGS